MTTTTVQDASGRQYPVSLSPETQALIDSGSESLAIPTLTAEEIAALIVVPPLLEGNCAARQRERVNQNRIVKGSSLAADVREITQKIRYLTDCGTIRNEIMKQLNKFKDANKATFDEIKRKMEEILPLLKIPTNPLKLPGYIKKVTIGRTLPDLDAAIDFIKRAIEVITAVLELVQAIQEVEPRLKACADQLEREVRDIVNNEIDKFVLDLEDQIRETIRETICGGLNELGVDDNLLGDIIDAVGAVKEMNNAFKGAMAAIQPLLKKHSGDLQSLTGVPPVFNFDNVDDLIASIETGTAINPATGTSPYDDYKAAVVAVYNEPDPVVATTPTITGTVEVGSVLTVSNGTWTNGSDPKEYTYTYQWYRSGVPIPEATNQTYELDIDDFDRTIYCIVTANQQVASEDAQSNTVGPVLMPTAGGNVPTITGSAVVGQTLTVSPATITKSWYTRVAPYRQYRWMRVDPVTNKTFVIEEDVNDNSAPFTATYIVTSADVGYKIMVQELVSVGLGNVKLSSALTATVT